MRKGSCAATLSMPERSHGAAGGRPLPPPADNSTTSCPVCWTNCGTETRNGTTPSRGPAASNPIPCFTSFPAAWRAGKKAQAPPRETGSHRKKRRMGGVPVLPDRPWMLLVIAVAGYFAFLVLVYLRQEKLLYFPDVYPLASAAIRAKTFHFRLWPENGPDYHGFVPADGPANPKGVSLLFHGNAGTAPDRFFYARALAPLGYLLILFESPGYGARPGDLREASFVSAAVNAARAAVDQFGGPLGLMGESLGRRVAGAVAAAENDEVTPPKRSRRLFELLPGKKRFWLLPGAGHNTWPDVVDSAWWREVLRFVSEGSAGSGATGERNGGS